jgi:hypothetical protein
MEARPSNKPQNQPCGTVLQARPLPHLQQRVAIHVCAAAQEADGREQAVALPHAAQHLVVGGVVGAQHVLDEDALRGLHLQARSDGVIKEADSSGLSVQVFERCSECVPQQ